ncbi:hypothetical protein HN385_04535 [archaeon]|jgi:hypothetical protein|nr:hypothetical protein [archaeon]MBT3450856.1 hypothetical protein [archaeon]MBT6868733.1 hypothetical protein [archaeon]MBT7192358.1 hypothetical protein [archaeon]MBT7381187.1 hypothetical protein [archaeon]
MPVNNQKEKVLYNLPIKKLRYFLPKFFTLTMLSGIFYLGIMFNLSMLKINAKLETQIQGISLLIIALLILLGILINLKKSATHYKFYLNRINVKKKKNINYINIENMTEKRNVLDKIFSTYTLVITDNSQPKKKEILIGPISSKVNIKDYINKMVTYVKTNPQSNYSQNYNQHNNYQKNYQKTNQPYQRNNYHNNSYYQRVG